MKDRTEKSLKPQFKTWWKKKWVRVIIFVFAVLLVVRILLEPIVLHYVNKALAGMDGYYGQVEDVDIALIRGAYTLNNIYINSVDSATKKETPFFKSRIVDLSVEWSSVFHGKFVGEFEMEDTDLLFTKGKTDPAQVQKDTSEFVELREKLMPLRVNRCEVTNGRLHYVDSAVTPAVDIWMSNMYLLARNLINVVDTSKLPATIMADADVYDGSLSFNMKLNPLAEYPTFDMNVECKNTSLPKLNDFFKAYGKFDVSSGTFGLYTEMAAADGKFVGYVKPLIKDLHVLGKEDRHDNILQKTWEAIVGAAAFVLRNQKTKNVATKVPISGTFDNTSIGTWEAVLKLLSNAFIQALQPSIDYEININSVTTMNKKQNGDKK